MPSRTTRLAAVWPKLMLAPVTWAAESRRSTSMPVSEPNSGSGTAATLSPLPGLLSMTAGARR